MLDNLENKEEITVHIKLPLSQENFREELTFYKELRIFFKDYNKNTDDIDSIINVIESNIDIFSDSKGLGLTFDESKLREQIEKHPYFKNPCDYPIRLLTIMKYLKQKGFNMNFPDIDIYIDKVVQKIQGVKKIGMGLYLKTKD